MTSSSNTYKIKTRTETPLQNLFLIFFNFVKFALESILTFTEQPQESGLAPSTGSSYIRTEKIHGLVGRNQMMKMLNQLALHCYQKPLTFTAYRILLP